MAQLLTIRLSRNDTSCPWGFRLQGGKDFGTPLLIQKVNGNSLAEKAGLQVGDAVVRVNNHELFDQRHKDAQDAIVRAGNSFEMTVQRGGNNTWKPAVVPIGSTPSPNPYISSAPSPVTKTSLKASSKPSSPAIGTGYNSTAKTFNNQVNGNCVNGNGSVKAIVNKQYNSPVGIYSDESIAETLSAQAEVLAGGVLGVNFKKNEKDYNAETSEVFKMVKEAEKEPKEPEPERPASVVYFATSSHAIGGRATSPRPQTPIAAVLPPSSPFLTVTQPLPKPTQVSHNCTDCRQPIVGVFVKIKDKNLHVECFKCATCGTSLKNVGYYNINNKLYCDIHAKMIARQNPPSPNLYPATDAQRPFSPAKMAPSCNLSNNQASRSPQSPAPTIAPIPFHAPRPSPTHVTPPVFSNQCVNNSYGKPSPPSQQAPTNQGCTFSSLNAESIEITNKCSNECRQSFNPTHHNRLPFLKPKPGESSAFTPLSKHEGINNKTSDPSNEIEKEYDKGPKRLSLCSAEVSQVLSQLEALNTLKSSLNTQVMLSVINESEKRPESPIPSESGNDFVHAGTPDHEKCDNVSIGCSEEMELISARPHSIRPLSPAPPRPLTPNQVVVFPPEVPAMFSRARSRTSTPQPLYITAEKCNKQTRVDPADDLVFSVERKCHKINRVSDSCCIIEDTKETISVTCSPVPFLKESLEPIVITELKDLPIPSSEPGPIATAASVAPERPFTPLEPIKPLYLQKPIPLPVETKPYIPPTSTQNAERPQSPFVKALTIASNRPYSPLPTESKPLPEPDEIEPKPKRVSMAEALAVAPDRQYHLLDAETAAVISSPKEVRRPSVLETGSLGELSDPSVILTSPVATLDTKPLESKQPKGKSYVSTLYVNKTAESSFPPVCDELKSVFKKRFTTVATPEPTQRPPSETGSTKQEPIATKRPPTPRHPFTPTGLHKPNTIPLYQQCVNELSSKCNIISSRRNTPTPTAIRATPIACHTPELLTSTSNTMSCALKSTATEFLTKSKDITEKIVPALGYDTEKIKQREKKENVEKHDDNPFASSGINVKLNQAVPFFSEKKNKESDTICCKKESEFYVSESTVSKTCITSQNVQSETCRNISSPQIPTSIASSNLESLNRNDKPSDPSVCKLTQTLSKTLSTVSKSENVSYNNRTLAFIPSKPNNSSSDPKPTGAGGGGSKTASSVGYSAPRRGRGVLNPQNLTPGARIPLCAQCSSQIRGPFVTALGKIWCPEHFLCVNSKCNRSLMDIGFVEEPSGLYCEYCFEQFLAPGCAKCAKKIKGDCLNAIGKHFHPECFTCAYCGKFFGNSPFFLEESLPYCENDWNELFTTKCFACGFPIEAGDRWVEALNNNYHSPCFNCTMCKTNLEGQSFYAKGGRPFCKNHAR